jgi:hypothetical protein
MATDYRNRPGPTSFAQSPYKYKRHFQISDGKTNPELGSGLCKEVGCDP